MNDCETMIIDELKELKKDVKSLLLDVNSLKVKSAMWGMIGGLIFTILTIVIPLLWKNVDMSKTNATPTKVSSFTVDTTKIHVDSIH